MLPWCSSPYFLIFVILVTDGIHSCFSYAIKKKDEIERVAKANRWGLIREISMTQEESFLVTSELCFLINSLELSFVIFPSLFCLLMGTIWIHGRLVVCVLNSSNLSGFKKKKTHYCWIYRWESHGLVFTLYEFWLFHYLFICFCMVLHSCHVIAYVKRMGNYKGLFVCIFLFLFNFWFYASLLLYLQLYFSSLLQLTLKLGVTKCFLPQNITDQIKSGRIYRCL